MQRTGLKKTTSNTKVKTMLEAGMIRVVGEQPSGDQGGKGAAIYDLPER
jgi:hypothetical protein